MAGARRDSDIRGKRWLPHSLRARLLLVLVAAGIPAITLNLFWGVALSRDAEERALKSLNWIAVSMVRDYKEALDSARYVAAGVTGLAEIHRISPAECGRHLAHVIETIPHFVNFEIARVDGTVYCAAGGAGRPTGYGKAPWFLEAVRGAEIALGPPEPASGAARTVLPAAIPLPDHAGVVSEVAVLTIDPTAIVQTMNVSSLPVGVAAVLVAGDGTVLARHPAVEREAPVAALESPVVRALLEGRGEGSATAVGVDGVERIYSFAPVAVGRAPATLFLAVGVLRSAVFGQARRVLSISLLILALVAVLALGVSWTAASRLVLGPAQAVVRAVGRMGTGDLTARTGLPRIPGEIGEIASAFDRMAEDLEGRAAQAERLRGEAAAHYSFLQAIVEGTPSPILVKDLDGRIIMVNSAGLREYGAKPEDVLGRDDFALFPHDVAKAIVEGDRQVIQTGKSQTYERRVSLQGVERVFLATVSPYVDPQGRVVGVVAVTHDITERKRSEAKILRHLETIKALYAGADRLSGSLDETLLARSVARDCSEIYGVSASRLGWAEPDGSISFIAQYPVNLAHHPTPMRWDESPEGMRPPGRVIRTRSPVVVEGLESESEIPGELALQLAGQGFHSAAILPLISQDRAVGVLSLLSDRPGFFDPERVEFFQAYAHLAAAALESARLHSETQRRAAEMAALYDTSLDFSGAHRDLAAVIGAVAVRASSLMGVPYCAVGISDRILRLTEIVSSDDPQFPRGVVMRDGDGATGRAAQTRQPVIVDDYRAWEHASVGLEQVSIGPVLAVPMLHSGEIVGTLSVHDRAGSSRRFTQDDANLLTMFAAQAAGAVRSSRLVSDLRVRLDQLQALHDIGIAISASLDLGVTLDVVTDKAMTHLSVDAVRVMLFEPQLQRLAFAAGKGFRTESANRARAQLGKGLTGRAAAVRRTLLVANLGLDPGLSAQSPEIRQEGFAAYCGTPLLSKGQVKGVLEVFRRTPLPATPQWLGFFEMLAAETAVAVENAQLLESTQRLNVQLLSATDSTLEVWARSLEARGWEPQGNARRVAEVTLRLAQQMGVRAGDLEHIRRGAMLHDLGMITIPEEILLKNGPLTEEEQAAVRRHPVVAHEMLSAIPYLQPALEIPYCHHERWDGTGYPRGLSGGQIPLAARIFAVVDVWDALRSPRPHREAWPEVKVLAYIREQSGRQLDPQVVEAFLQMIREA